jgi:indolepyruvate ferredoxin oxidoreductase beta subunit
MENNKVTNILLSGVGGQGAILASNILAHVFVEAGYEVKKSEVHGMAQRGGDVTTHFRYGKKVYSPLIKSGDADFLLAFELLEALRYINYCKNDAKIVINDQKIFPPAVNLGQAQYPELGNAQAANVVLVGAFSNFIPEINDDMWLAALTDLLPKKILELNIKAFQKGKKAV